MQNSLGNVDDKKHLTYWLPLQEVDVVEHFPVFGTQVIQPILNDALAFLSTTGTHGFIEFNKITCTSVLFFF